MDKEITKPSSAVAVATATSASPPKTSEHRIVKSATIVAAMTLISRLMGFVRDVVLAGIFGAGPAFDAFVIAFKLPNFMRRLFAEGAFSQAFVPVLSEYRAKNTHEEVQQFINRIAGGLSLVLFIITILAIIAAPFIITVFAPGFSHGGERYDYATHMLRIIFPYILLISLTAFTGATLNTYRQFALPAFTPVLLNVVLILVACLWAPYTAVPIYTLAWGVLIGGVVQFVAQLPSMYRLNLFPIPKVDWKDEGVKRVLKLMVPALFGVSVAQLSLLIDSFFASFLQAGSISWLYYSDRLIYLPQGVIGVALATVVLPHLAQHHSQKNGDAYSKTLDWALRSALVVGIPSAIGLFFLAGPILATMIKHGVFNNFDVIMTTKSLRAFTIGLPAFMIIKILASAFYSRQNIKTPVKIAGLAMGVNLLLNIALIFPLAHAGLALSTSIASIFNALCLFFLLWRQKIYRPNPGWSKLLIRLFLANAIMTVVIVLLTGDLNLWLNMKLFTKVWHLVGIIGIGLLTYFGCLLLFGVRKRDFRPTT